MGKLTQHLLGTAGNPEPGVPFAKAAARKLGLTDPLGKSTYWAQFKSSYPANVTEQIPGALHPMLHEEMVSKLAE